MTSRGQTVIPKAIRDQLGLQPGDVIDFLVRDSGDVVLRPAVEDVRQLKGLLHRPGRRPVSIKQMNAAIRERVRRSP